VGLPIFPAQVSVTTIIIITDRGRPHPLQHMTAAEQVVAASQQAVAHFWAQLVDFAVHKAAPLGWLLDVGHTHPFLCLTSDGSALQVRRRTAAGAGDNEEEDDDV
jgi:hypothetical protein